MEAFRVARFVEKPDGESARSYVENGFLWNSGNFLFMPKVMIEELEQYFWQADTDGNVLDGLVTRLGTSKSVVRSEGSLTAVIGLENAVVVSTTDAVLVTSRGAASRVKDPVKLLADQGREEAANHLRIYRPRGWYQRIDIRDRFQVKHICVKRGSILSLQRHHHRAEHWVVVPHGRGDYRRRDQALS